MNEERYPGERRGLRLFLEGLLGAVDEHLGRDALLYHRIRIALERGDLKSLRSARQMFNHQDTALKRRLSMTREQRRGRAASTARLVVAHEGPSDGGTPNSGSIVRLVTAQEGGPGD